MEVYQILRVKDYAGRVGAGDEEKGAPAEMFLKKHKIKLTC
jgi:hypothetical protein